MGKNILESSPVPLVENIKYLRLNTPHIIDIELRLQEYPLILLLPYLLDALPLFVESVEGAGSSVLLDLGLGVGG